MSHTNDIAHRLADLLTPELAGFKYVKSRTEFRKSEGDIAYAIGIDVNTRGSTSGYSIAFRIGVIHTAVECLIAEIDGEKLSPYARTISQYSPNVLKQDVLPYKGAVWWWGIPKDSDFSTIQDELRSFIIEFALPYCERFSDLMLTRESLVSRDGLSLNLLPFKQVLAMDAVSEDRDHVVSYLRLLQEEIDGGYQHNCDIFNQYYPLLKAKFEHLFPECKLNKKQA